MTDGMPVMTPLEFVRDVRDVNGFVTDVEFENPDAVGACGWPSWISETACTVEV